MWNRIGITIIVLLFIAAPVWAQSDDLPPITAANAQQLALIKTIPFPRSTYDGEIGNFVAAFSADGQQLALGQQGKLTLVNIENGVTIAEVESGLNFRPLNLYLSTDEKYLAAVDKDYFCVWDIAANVLTFCESLVINLPNEYSDGLNYVTARAATFSADSAHLYVVSDNYGVQGVVIHSYDLKKAREVDRIQIKNCPNDPYNLIAFQLSTTHLVCVNYNETRFDQPFVFIYDSDTGELVSSWNLDDDIPEQITRNQYGTLANELSTDITFFDPPSVYPYNRYQKLFNPTGTLIALIPLYGDGVELYGIVDCAATTQRDINLRTEPNTDAPVGATFLVGQRLALLEQTTNGGFTWWQTGDGLWLREDVAEVDCPP